MFHNREGLSDYFHCEDMPASAENKVLIAGDHCWLIDVRK